MRTINSPALAALAGPVTPAAYMVEMQLTETLRLTTAAYDIEHGGHTWIGAGQLVDIQPVKESRGVEALQFSLSGATAELVALARAEPIKGRRVRVYIAIFDPATHAVLDAPLIWTGTLDQMPIKLSGGEQPTATIGVTAQHRGVTAGRPKPLRYTDADQQRLHPGDTCMRFITSQVGQRIVWPAAAWFKNQQ